MSERDALVGVILLDNQGNTSDLGKGKKKGKEGGKKGRTIQWKAKDSGALLMREWTVIRERIFHS